MARIIKPQRPHLENTQCKTIWINLSNLSHQKRKKRRPQNLPDCISTQVLHLLSFVALPSLNLPNMSHGNWLKQLKASFKHRRNNPSKILEELCSKQQTVHCKIDHKNRFKEPRLEKEKEKKRKKRKGFFSKKTTKKIGDLNLFL